MLQPTVSVDGFSVVADETQTTGGSGPGFDVVGALGGLLALGLFAARRK